MSLSPRIKLLLQYTFGFLAMLTGSYIDNLRGPLLPVLKEELNIGSDFLSLFLVCGHLAAVCAAALLLVGLARVSERWLIYVALVLISSIAAVSFLPHNLIWFFGMAVLFGAGNTSINTISNLQVLRVTSAKYEARAMSALHTMYGTGSVLASAVLAILLRDELSWEWALILLMLPVAVLFSLSFFIDHPTPPQRAHTTELEPKQKLEKAHILLLVLFSTYIAAEVMTSMWLSSFLVKVRGLTPGEASSYVSGLFLMMVTTRVFSIIFATPQMQTPLLWASIVGSLSCLVLGHLGLTFAFCLAGCFGPFFPILISKIKSCYPTVWPKLTVKVIFVTQAVLGMVHLAVGFLAENLGMQTAYWIPVALFIIVVPLLKIYLVEERAVIMASR